MVHNDFSGAVDKTDAILVDERKQEARSNCFSVEKIKFRVNSFISSSNIICNKKYDEFFKLLHFTKFYKRLMNILLTNCISMATPDSSPIV